MSGLCSLAKSMPSCTMDALATTSTGALVGWGVAAIVVLANAKSLPLAYTFRLLPSLYRLFRPRIFSKPPKPTPTTAPGGEATAASPALFTHHRTASRAVLLDIDINIHKSNSTFFADADINRAALLTTLLSTALATTTPSRKRPAMFILAGVQCSFRREIGPFQAYDVSSRVLCWDEKSIYVVTYFLKPGMRLDGGVEVEGGPAALFGDEKARRGVFAVMVARYVFKAGRETVRPADVLAAAGLLVEGGEAGGERVEKAVGSGLEYVKGCML